MALRSNGNQYASSGIQHFGVNPVLSAIPHVLRDNFGQNGRARNIFASEGMTDDKISIPEGVRHPVAWIMARKDGGMSSRNVTGLTITPTALAVGGITTTGAASFTIDFALATGGLIASGDGTATIVISTNNPLLTASLNAIGDASFTVSTNTPLLGAIASGEGSAAILLNATASILPIDDTSPLRDGTATFSITGTLTPYAIGIMEGSTVDSGNLTVDAIKDAVWNAVATNYQTTGTMGSRLNSAASGGVDYGSMADAVRTELQAELLRIVELAQIHGLVIGADLVVTPTSRTAGGVAQTIVTAPASTTISRT